MPKSKIPDRWEDYSNIGDVIAGTKFITFKVPLNKTFELRRDLKFTPNMLVKSLESKNLDLGLVIDLTNTTRYYNSSDLLSLGILYEKIFVPGHVIPSDDIFQRFTDTVASFFKKEGNKDKLIGVHCTHGLNRTGYMVCRYMIEMLGIEPEKCISDYGAARGYPIERENYLEDLRKRTPGRITLGIPDDKKSHGRTGASQCNQLKKKDSRQFHHHGNVHADYSRSGRGHGHKHHEDQKSEGHQRDELSSNHGKKRKKRRQSCEGIRHGNSNGYENKRYRFEENIGATFVRNHGQGYRQSHQNGYEQRPYGDSYGVFNKGHRPKHSSSSQNAYNQRKRAF